MDMFDLGMVLRVALGVDRLLYDLYSVHSGFLYSGFETVTVFDTCQSDSEMMWPGGCGTGHTSFLFRGTSFSFLSRYVRPLTASPSLYTNSEGSLVPPSHLRHPCDVSLSPTSATVPT